MPEFETLEMPIGEPGMEDEVLAAEEEWKNRRATKIEEGKDSTIRGLAEEVIDGEVSPRLEEELKAGGEQ